MFGIDLSKMCRRGAIVALWCSVVPVLQTAHGQLVSDFERSRYTPAAFYNYAESGDVTIRVNVWGTVRNPGLYEVPKDTRLSTLFSLAGGPIVTVRQRNQTRWVQANLTRTVEGTQRIILEHTMVDAIFALEEDPVLNQGDILTVETVLRQGTTWRDIFPIVAAVASVALAVERVSR